MPDSLADDSAEHAVILIGIVPSVDDASDPAGARDRASRSALQELASVPAAELAGGVRVVSARVVDVPPPHGIAPRHSFDGVPGCRHALELTLERDGTCGADLRRRGEEAGRLLREIREEPLQRWLNHLERQRRDAWTVELWTSPRG